MNESKAKQVCKKRALDMICHTETQLVRCYPNARRFDSSNFSPINFWSCGIQLVALNYQTVDTFQILNQALFEQNANKGYVLKPPCLWDRQHADYGRFNPFEKKKEAEFINFHLKLISGQYLTDLASVFTSGNNSSDSLAASGLGLATNNNPASAHYRHQHRASAVDVLQTTCTFIEIELIGIPCDCAKEKTKALNRNALNPIWNEEFTFHVVFPDLAFVKFSVIDNTNNHLLSQRVLPLKCLRPGYRHVKLRNSQNQPLELSTIFVHSRQTLECVQSTPTASLANAQGVNSGSSVGLVTVGTVGEVARAQAKHKQFKLTVYGGASDEEGKESGGVQVKVTQDTTVLQVIEQVKPCFLPSIRLFRSRSF
jgi:phosphatidylinositol phospholipase C epsilon